MSGQRNTLANYILPLGSNEVDITIIGQELTLEDFDALIEYVKIFRRQYERRVKYKVVKTEESRTEDISVN